MDQLLRERVQDGQVKGLIWELATAGQGLPEAGPELRYQSFVKECLLGEAGKRARGCRAGEGGD